MVNQQLLDYIKQQLQQGMSKEQIKSSLMANGWQAQDVDEALETAMTGSQTQTNGVPVAPEISSVPRRKLWPKIALGVIAILLIGGGGVVAYNHFMISPNGVVAKALANVKQFKTAEYQLMMEIEATVGEETIKANQKAIEDLAKENPALSAALKKSLDDSAKNSKSVFISDVKTNLENPNDLRTDATNKTESAITSLNNITRTITAGGKTYITLLEGEEYSVLTLYASKNQWVMFGGDQSSNAILGLFTQTGGKAGTLRQDFLNGKFFKTVTKNSDENIDGMNTYHFTITLDDVALKNAFGDLVDSLLGTVTNNGNNPVAQVAKQVSFSNLDLWISKGNQIPRKAIIAMTTGDPKILTNKITYTYTLKKFNQPVTIDIPTNWITFEEASKWETYRNNEYGFEFKYPASQLKPDESSAGNSGNGWVWVLQIGYPDRLGAFADILVFDGKIDDAIQAGYANQSRLTILKTEEKTVGLKNVKMITWKDSANPQIAGIQYFIQFQIDKVLIITPESSQTQLSNQILSTFKFIE